MKEIYKKSGGRIHRTYVISRLLLAAMQRMLFVELYKLQFRSVLRQQVPLQ